MATEWITAEEMAGSAGIDPKQFRKALRAEKFAWHAHYDRWTVRRGSDDHRQMQVVLARLLES